MRSLACLAATLLVVGCTVELDESTVDQELGPPSDGAVAVCPGPAEPGTARCHVHVIVDDRWLPLAATTPSGYGPSDLTDAYKITSAGSSTTILAIVDAFGYPNAESDLAAYRSQFGLPACTTANGCFQKVDQTGGTNYPRTDTGWDQEQALDLDMASAICPSCQLLLVEAKTNSLANLGTAVNYAATAGAHVISNSYGAGESSYDTTYDTTYFHHPGVAITVSTGDNGYGVEYPAASQYVTAVGGTHLVRASNSRGWSETTWSGAGSGCSKYDPKPAWQKDAGCAMRTVADVSADADPSTGVAVYGPARRKQSGWMVFGGTSVASPIIAGAYAVNGGKVDYGSDPYAHTGALFDVTSGSNGNCGGSYLCTATTGYDGPTGLGTPSGTGAF